MTPHKDSCLDPRPSAPTPLLPLSPVLSDALQVCHPHAAGIDIGDAEHWGAVPPGRDPQPVRRFGTFTADLDALAAWLMDGGVTTVAMASTGVYWMPLFALLEARGLEVLLIAPRQATRAPGRPTTDRLDCKGLQRLHAYGLLAAAFRPAEQVWVRRSSLRHRQMLLPSGAHHMQHRHKALQQMHLTLSQVVSDLTSVTGLAMLHAIIAGERAPLTLAKLRHPHCQHREEEIAKALQGTWRAEHLCALQPAVDLYHFYHQQLPVCEHHIQAHLGTCAEKSDGQPLPPKPRRHKKVNEPRFDARTPLDRLAGVDLTTIEGIAAGTALVILSEIGTDMSRWPRVKHLCSWLGLSPHHKISGGKVLARRVRPGAQRVTVALRPGAQRVTVALRLAARTVHQAHPVLGAFYRRMHSRSGAPKAITATAHKLARLVYSLFKHGSAYVQQGIEAYERQDRERKLKALARQARAFGSTLMALGTPAVPSLAAVAAPTPCAGTTRYRRPLPYGGKGGVSAHASTVSTGRPATTRHGSRSPLYSSHFHRVSSLGGFIAVVSCFHRHGVQTALVESGACE
jgi:transposase